MNNFLAMNLQKLALELKCHSCLNLMKTPTWLSCNHMFCSHCVNLNGDGSYCPVCRLPFTQKEVRPANHMESIVNIYKEMLTALGPRTLNQCSRLEIHDLQTETMKHSSQSLDSGKEDLLEVSQECTDGRTSGKLMHCEPLSENKKFGKLNDAKDLSLDKQPCSPPSAEEYGSNNRGHANRTKRRPTEESSKKGIQSASSHGTEEDAKELKRQKLNSESDLTNIIRNTTCKGITRISCEEFEQEKQPHDQQDSFNNSYPSEIECAFCHCPGSHEGSGPMLHYLNGHLVVDDNILQPNVVHVHQKCIEWAPQVYFEGDTAMNLTAEVSRAAKIKCSQCGRKGAALGCYIRSCRRSFHVPCAVKVPKCRWDCENFLVLCPSHSSYKLPCDKTRAKKKTEANSSSAEKLTYFDAPKIQTESIHQSGWHFEATPNVSSSMTLSGSFLSSEDKDDMYEFASLIGAGIVKGWKENVTHIIASTDEYGGCTRSFKVLMGILNGKWILKVDWIKACLEAGCLVPEEPYEISHDVHGCFGGPKNGRIRAMNKEPKLFSGLTFYLSGYYMPYYKTYIEDLISGGGGMVLQKIDIKSLDEKTSNPIRSNIFVVYSVEPPQGCEPNDVAGVVEKRSDEAEALATELGAKAIPHIWILDTIAACCLPEI